MTLVVGRTVAVNAGVVALGTGESVTVALAEETAVGEREGGLGNGLTTMAGSALGWSAAGVGVGRAGVGNTICVGVGGSVAVRASGS
ncbi:MAG: hypothetical protein EXR51_08150 [Dehalococcoidia bacterium]|nr:hypothetical protein [Dehalococcoidia bacterium]